MLTIEIATKPSYHPARHWWRPIRSRNQSLTYHLGETLPDLAAEILNNYRLATIPFSSGECLLLHTKLDDACQNTPPIWVTMLTWLPPTKLLPKETEAIFEHFARGVGEEIAKWSAVLGIPPCMSRVELKLPAGRGGLLGPKGIVYNRWG